MRRRDAGITLVDTLMAVAILGIAVVTIVGGMMTMLRSADLNRDQGDANDQLRAFAAAVRAASYADCTTWSGTLPYAGAYAATGQFTASVTGAAWWDGSTGSPVFTAWAPGNPACSTDNGLQRLTLTVASNDGRDTESMSVVKRRRAATEVNP